MNHVAGVIGYLVMGLVAVIVVMIFASEIEHLLGRRRRKTNVRESLYQLDYEMTDRGFKHYPPITTSYGHVVKVYESSSAEVPHLWLDVGGVSAHMTLTQASTLRNQLSYAIVNHYHTT